MVETKQIQEIDYMPLPTLSMPLGDGTFPYQDNRRQYIRRLQYSDHELEGTIKRLIAHLKEDWD